MTQESRTDKVGKPADHRAYWRANLRLIGVLLTIWALVSFVFGILLVEQLNAWKIGDLPLGFWFAQQGAIYVFIVLIYVYARSVEKLDDKYSVEKKDPGPVKNE